MVAAIQNHASQAAPWRLPARWRESRLQRRSYLFRNRWYVSPIIRRVSIPEHRTPGEIRRAESNRLKESKPTEGPVKPMRNRSKALVVVLAALAIIGLSPAARANDLLVGTFTLSHATQWNKVVLPAGVYTLKVDRTASNTNILMVRGEKQNVVIPIYPNSVCASCQSGALHLAVQGDQRIVSWLELPGFHVDFKMPHSDAEREQQGARQPGQSEQIAVRFGQAN